MDEIRTGGDGRLQRRKPRGGGFTKAKRKVFLDVLADTCNVRRAAAAAGVGRDAARRLRLTDAVFARLYQAAVDQSRERLEEHLVAMALGDAAVDDNPDGERDLPARSPFDPALALKVLQLRVPGGRASTRASPAASQEDVDAALLTRLARLAKAQVRS